MHNGLFKLTGKRRSPSENLAKDVNEQFIEAWVQVLKKHGEQCWSPLGSERNSGSMVWFAGGLIAGGSYYLRQKDGSCGHSVSFRNFAERQCWFLEF